MAIKTTSVELTLLLDELSEQLQNGKKPIKSEIKNAAKGILSQITKQYEEHKTNCFNPRKCPVCKQFIEPELYFKHISSCQGKVLARAKKVEIEEQNRNWDEKVNNTTVSHQEGWPQEIATERQMDGSRDYYQYHGSGDGKWISHPLYDNMDDESNA